MRGGAATRCHAATSPAVLPAVTPGELWLVECAVTTDLPVFERRALTSANVIIYDRVIEETVAAALPIGGYDEPSVGDDVGRCVQFVRDGWSVVRLIERVARHADFADRACGLAARLRSAGAPADLSVSGLISVDTPMFQKTEARLDEADALIDGIRDGTGRAIVFSASAPSTAFCLYPVASNGLAG